LLRKTPAPVPRTPLSRAFTAGGSWHLSLPRRGLKPCGLENGVLLRKTPACIRHLSLPRRGTGCAFPSTVARYASTAGGGVANGL
jgi:hypothetical protein